MAGIRFDAKDLLQNLENAETKSQVAIKMYATQGAKKFENYAKKNRPWTDRTGHARQRLKGYIEEIHSNLSKIKICIAHGVDYGVYLELCNEKKYAILQRTINECSKEVIQGFMELWKHI